MAVTINKSQYRNLSCKLGKKNYINTVKGIEYKIDTTSNASFEEGNKETTPSNLNPNLITSSYGYRIDVSLFGAGIVIIDRIYLRNEVSYIKGYYDFVVTGRMITNYTKSLSAKYSLEYKTYESSNDFITGSNYTKSTRVFDGIRSDSNRPESSYNRDTGTYSEYDGTTEGITFKYSEDCLFLNMYVPRNATNAPVIVFFHGGSFTRGSGDEKPFDGAEYAKRGVIFVTVNYRLNVFGFYADKEHCKGNLALYDQLCAIEWIRHNISHFGGDKESIVLMGQSAGAMSVCDMVSSPLLEGKIKGAIMLSGGGVRRIILPKRKPNVKFWKGIMKKCGAETFEDFQNVPERTLFDAWRLSNPLKSLFATAPVIDDELVVKGGENKYGVPCIVGSLKRDMMPSELRAMARRYARKLRKIGKPCYIFKFTHNLPECKNGTFHSADLWYAIGAMQNSHRPFDDDDYALSCEMIDRFVAFSKTCSPNVEYQKEWKSYNSNKDVLIFD